MNSEEQFKESLNNLLASKEFSFEESSWDQARQVIDASKKRKRRALLVLFSSLFFLSISVAGFFFFQAKNNPLRADHSRSGENVLPATKKTPPVDAPEIIAESEKNSESDSRLPETSPEPLTLSSGQIDVSIKRSFGSSKSDAPQPESTTGGKTDPMVTKVNPKVGGNENAKNTSAVPYDAVITTPFTGTVPPSSPEKPAQQTNTNPPSIAATSIAREAEIPAPPIETTVTITPTIAGTLAAMEPFTENSVVIREVPDSVAKNLEAANPPATNSILAAAVAKPDTDYVRRKKPILLVEAGVSYLFGWNTAERKEAIGINPVIGINYLNSVSPDLSIGFGIQYTSVGHLKYNSYTSKVSKLNFGEESDVTVYTPATLHYVVAPLRVIYKLDQKNRFGLGCNLAYLLTVSGKIEKYTETIQGRSEIQTSRSTGYSQGFKQFDIQLAAFYKRQLYKNYFGKIEFFYGLNSAKDATLFPSTSASRNLGLKLTLIYDIFKNY